MKKTILSVVVLCVLVSVILAISATADAESVAKIGSVSYDTLEQAVAAANAMEVGADEFIEITLLKDLYLKEKLTISKNMIISGKHTIYRSNDYLGQMFSVPAGVNFKLEDVTIDGRNKWTYNLEKMKTDIQTMSPVYGGGYEAYAIFEEGAPVGTGAIIGVGGEVVVSGCTFKDHVGPNIFWVGGAGKLDINETLIDHNTRTGGPVVVGVDAGGVVNINDGTVISNHFSDGNGLLGVIYGKAYINGGEIFNNAGNNCNGYIFMLYGENAYCEMNGGYIHDNFGARGWSNGWNSAFYVYGNGTQFVMNGGVLSGNFSSSVPGIANNGTNAKITLNGGTIINTHSQGGYVAKDLYAYCTVNINNVVNSAKNGFYGNLINNGALNGDAYFYKYTASCTGNGEINGNVYIRNGAKTTLVSGMWNGIVTVSVAGNGTKLTVQNGAIINGPCVRVLCAVDSADSENADQATTVQSNGLTVENGAQVNSPILYYHRLTSEQKSDIVITFDYNGGLDAQNWSGIQRTASGDSYIIDSFPQPTKSGYILSGWVIADDQTVESLDMSGTTAYANGTPTTQSTRLIAVWKSEKEHTVTFEYTGEIPAEAPQLSAALTVEAGKDVVLPEITMKGYTFAWDTSVLDNGKMPDKDIIIVGTWTKEKPKEYTVTFQYSGEIPEGAPTLPAAGTYEAGQTVVIPDVTMKGYTFAWDTSVLDNGKMPENVVVIVGTWTAVPSNPEEPPQTGDNTKLMLWMMMLAVSLVGITVLSERKCRR